MISTLSLVMSYFLKAFSEKKKTNTKFIIQCTCYQIVDIYKDEETIGSLRDFYLSVDIEFQSSSVYCNCHVSDTHVQYVPCHVSDTHVRHVLCLGHFACYVTT